MSKALYLHDDNGNIKPKLAIFHDRSLQDNEVLVNIEWSGLNYKDALAITGTGKIIRHYPLIPGIDFAGTVSESNDHRYKAGDSVLLTGWGVGENYCGGLSEKAYVNADWLVPLPEKLTTRQAMIIGTAGLTAMLCVMALEDGGIHPENGPIIVTGATGGVGSISIQLLHQLGYQITAVTHRNEHDSYLTSLGASKIISHQHLVCETKPLQKQLWAGAIDTLGGQALATLLAQIQYQGTVAACGLAESVQLNTTVMPFILRNVRLQGIDSVMIPYSLRVKAWQRLAQLLPEPFYHQVSHEITLEGVVETANKIINHQHHGRTIVNLLAK